MGQAGQRCFVCFNGRAGGFKLGLGPGPVFLFTLAGSGNACLLFEQACTGSFGIGDQ